MNYFYIDGSTASNGNNDKSDNGALIGGIVGGIVGGLVILIIIIIIVIVLFWRIRKRHTSPGDSGRD